MIRKIAARGLCSAIVSVGLLSVAMPAGAAEAKPAAAKKAEKIWCPYMDISIKKAKAPKSSHKNKTYYFCCDDCKVMFDKDPAKQAAAYDKKVAAHNKAQAKPKAKTS